MAILLRILSYFRQYWFATATAYGCLLVVTGIELYVPDLIRQVIDCGIGGGASSRSVCPGGSGDPLAVVAHAALLVLGLTVLKGGFQFGQGYLGEYGAQRTAYRLRNDLYQKLQQLSFSWHDRAQTGQLMTRATSDVEQLRNFTGRGLVQIGQMLFTTVGISAVLLITNWKLALASVLLLPLIMRTVAYYNEAVRPYFWRIQQELAVLAAVAQENIAGAKVVRAFARESDEIDKFNRQNDALQDQYLAAAEVQSFTNPLMDVMAQLGTVVVLWVGGYLIISGELSVGQLVAFNAYLLLLVRPARRLGFIINQSSRAMAAGERIFEILDAAVDVANKPDAVALPPIKGEVVFDHVYVSYYGGELVLRDVSLHAQPGQTVALLGGTGSGKTSIVNLIPRFYDVSGGRVTIDGYDVRDVELQSLRRQVGMVLQDTLLFTGTIRENIAFGQPEADEERIYAAARAARAHSFITEFPDGYETRVGERGVTLSGGQKQRIAIARALLLDPRILILDDFTSAVDTETEALIREALDVLMEGRTTFVIAQRVSTVQSADQIVVLERGQIVGMGTHEELLQNNEIYAEIAQLQLMNEVLPDILQADEIETSVLQDRDDVRRDPAGAGAGRGFGGRAR
jgi:ABC-type multidrug transport system fused ATPase/permease subunit